LDGEFKVGFAEPIETSTLQISLNRTGTLKTPVQNQSSVAFTYELTQNNSSLSVKTNALLEYGTYYELVLAAGLKDIQGNTTATEEKVAFCTVPFKQPVYKVTKNGQEVNSVQLGESYQLVATLENGSDKTQTVDAILQLRGGKGVRENYGGTVLAQSSQEINKLKSGENTDITIDFTIPQDMDSFEICADIFAWEKDGKSAGSKPFHFSCPVE
ncbi:MAG: Ig-like domain-containing protein, partial [Syntrophomonadaceae bacterium]|nr:Ig-like domain-containing protein [Syntrophomonadaceae bacterium]